MLLLECGLPSLLLGTGIFEASITKLALSERNMG